MFFSMSTKKILAIITILGLVIFGIIVTIFAVVFGAVFVGSKSTYEYKCSMEQVRSNSDAKSLLGEPIEESFYIIPSIKIEGSRRFVEFSTTLSGSKGEGTLKVNSIRDGFRSDFLMILEKDGNATTLYKGKYPCKE